MAEPKPKTVSVRSVKSHTYDNIPREPDTIYEADEQYVETLIALGFAMREKQPAAPKPVAKKPAPPEPTEEKAEPEKPKR